MTDPTTLDLLADEIAEYTGQNFTSNYVDDLLGRAEVALRDRLTDLVQCERTRTSMRRILDAVAVAVKGDAPPLTAHDWSDLPALVAALRADNERLSTACASAIAEGRKRVDQSLREFGYDSMEFAECRAAWHSCIGGLRAHIDQDTVTAWMRSAAAIDHARGAE